MSQLALAGFVCMLAGMVVAIMAIVQKSSRAAGIMAIPLFFVLRVLVMILVGGRRTILAHRPAPQHCVAALTEVVVSGTISDQLVDCFGSLGRMLASRESLI